MSHRRYLRELITVYVYLGTAAVSVLAMLSVTCP